MLALEPDLWFEYSGSVWIIIDDPACKRIQIEIGIEIGIDMALGHVKLDVYRLSIGYVAWVYEKSVNLKVFHRTARDQWLRASQSISLYIVEGNGKTTKADRRRYFQTARGSASDFDPDVK